MKITFYNSINPKRLLGFNNKYKTLGDVAIELSNPGEPIELEAQQEQVYSNLIPVFRSVKLRGKFKACFELHNNINFTLDAAELVNPMPTDTGTIILAADFTGSITIINSKLGYTNESGMNMALWRISSPENNLVQKLALRNATVDGICTSADQVEMQGKVTLKAPSQEYASVIASANWQMSQADLELAYAYLQNNADQAVRVKKITCLLGPVKIVGNWSFATMNLNQKAESASFEFDGTQMPTAIAMKQFTKTAAPSGNYAFYANNADLNLTDSQLGNANDKLQASITQTVVRMNHVTDNLVWHLEGINALKLDEKSVTSLRSRQSEFTGELPENTKKRQANAQTKTTKTAPNNTKNVLPGQEDQIADKTDYGKDATNTKKDTQDDNSMSAISQTKAGAKQNGMQKLNSMIGLKDVKRAIRDYAQTAKFNVKADKRGLQRATNINRNMVFGGNPGTGKTTVAKYMAQILNEIGALPTARIKAITAKDLIGEHLGETMPKTAAMIKEAEGGVLFIDEAYILGSKTNSFNEEAVTQLLTSIDHNHDNLIVIIAGYTDKMKELFKINSGFRSRFNHWIDFPDYTDQEKDEIFLKDCHDNGLTINHDILQTKVFKWLMKFYSRDHANGRSVANLFDALTQARINRVLPQMDHLTNEAIMTITAADVKTVYQDSLKTLKREKAEKARAQAAKINALRKGQISDE